MKKNPNLLGLIITLGIIGICYLFYLLFLDKKDSYLVTNPTDQPLEIQIDDRSFKLAPNQITPIDLQKGEHRLRFDLNGTQVDTLFQITRANGVINPTKADYYVFLRPYGPARNVDSLFTSHQITIDDKLYYGNIKRFNDFYIQDFYYNLDQDYPKAFVKKGEHIDVSKIFTKDEFKQFYFENYE